MYRVDLDWNTDTMYLTGHQVCNVLIRMCLFVHVYTCLCVSVCACVCMCVFMHVCVCMHVCAYAVFIHVQARLITHMALIYAGYHNRINKMNIEARLHKCWVPNF